MKGEFYKMDFRAWNTGTVDLTLEQEAAYLRLCHAMYDAQGPIPASIRLLQGIFRCGNVKAAALVEQLVAAGKIQRTADGMLTNRRVEAEVAGRAHLSNVRRLAGSEGARARRLNGSAEGGEPRVTAECSSTDPEVSPEWPLTDHGLTATKPLKTNDTALAIAQAPPSRGDKRRGDTPIVPKGTDAEGFAEFWAAYPRRYGDNPRKTASRAYARAIRQGANPATLLVAVKAYAAELSAKGRIGTEFVAQAVTWLNQERFARFAQGAGAQGGEERSDPAAYLARLTDDQWREHLRRWRSTGGAWTLTSRTPAPDNPRTKVPQPILAEFGIEHTAAAGQGLSAGRIAA